MSDTERLAERLGECAKHISDLLDRGSNAPLGWAARLAAIGGAIRDTGRAAAAGRTDTLAECRKQINKFLTHPGNDLPGWTRWEKCQPVYEAIAACGDAISAHLDGMGR